MKKKASTIRNRKIRLALCSLTGALLTFASRDTLGQGDNSAPHLPAQPTNTAVDKAIRDQTDKYIEHWDVLPLAGNSLPATPPLLGEKDELPDFTRELIQVQWRPGDPIDLYVIRPKKAAKPPVVLFLYGYPSDTDRFRDDTYCESIVKRGLAAVGFVSALTGHRYHDLPMKEWFVSELQESLGGSVHDVQMILNYLQARGDFDMSRVGIYGQGSGGTIALLAASADSRLSAVDILDPWGDWPDWIAKSPLIPEDERPTYLTPAFLKSIAPLDPIQMLPGIASRRLRLQQTVFSEVTPAEARQRIMQSIPSTAQRLEYKSVDDYQARASRGGNILAWLQDQLRSKSIVAAKGPAVSQQR